MSRPIPLRFRCVLFLSLTLVAGSLVSADDDNWPQWRGPTGDGVARAAATPPTSWSNTENVKWKTAIPGSGSNTPIVWENRIYLLTAIPKDGDGSVAAPPAGGPGRGGERGGGERGQRGGERGGPPGRGGGGPPAGVYQFAVICLDRDTGKVLWQKVVSEQTPHEGTHPTNTYSSGSAVTDGKHLYAWFGSFGLYCMTMDGEVLWERDFGNMRARNNFGEGGSPALHGDTLVVPWDHEGPSKLFAVDTKTGQTKWEVDRDEPTTWATPLITEYQGQVQVITNGTNRVRSYDLADGKIIWECGGQVTNPIPTPLRFEDSVIVMTGYRGFSIYSIPLDSKGDITGSDKVNWSRNDSAPYVSSPVLTGGKLYFTKSRDALYSVVDAKTGELLEGPSRLNGIDTLYASPIAANGHVYFSGRNGATIVLKCGETTEVVATNQLGETLDASPVAIGNQLFLRGDKHLYCIEQ